MEDGQHTTVGALEPWSFKANRAAANTSRFNSSYDSVLKRCRETIQLYNDMTFQMNVWDLNIALDHKTRSVSHAKLFGVDTLFASTASFWEQWAAGQEDLWRIVHTPSAFATSSQEQAQTPEALQKSLEKWLRSIYRLSEWC